MAFEEIIEYEEMGNYLEKLFIELTALNNKFTLILINFRLFNIPA